MNLSICILILVQLWTHVQGQAASADALRECGNIHQLQFQNLPNAHGEFLNSSCVLKCSVGERVLSQDALNEGFPCPSDLSGICHNGQCVTTATPQTAALRECGNLHHEDFHQVNGIGTAFSNGDCTLTCVLNRLTISTNFLNEGYPCPQNPNGICQSGRCVLKSVTTVTPNVTTIATKAVLAMYSIDHIQVIVDSANLTFEIGPSSVYACISPTKGGPCIGSPGECSKDFNTRSFNPKWGLNCSTTGTDPHMNMDGLSIALEQQTGQPHILGYYNETIETLFDSHFKGSTDNLREYAFEDHYPITSTQNLSIIGHFLMKMDFKLTRR